MGVRSVIQSVSIVIKFKTPELNFTISNIMIRRSFLLKKIHFISYFTFGKENLCMPPLNS